MDKNIKIFALGKKALAAFHHLYPEHLAQIGEVVIGEDKQVEEDYSEAIAKFCMGNNIPYYYKNNASTFSPPFLIAIGWRWLIKAKHDQQLIIFHDSILPKYRGFNPLVTALINGDPEIGVTCLKGTEAFDKGDIISQYKKSIKYPLKIKDAIDIVAEGYGVLLMELIDLIHSGTKIEGEQQNEDNATYSVWRDAADYYIDWSRSAEEINRFIDAVGFPYSGARAVMAGREIIVHEAEVEKPLVIENKGVGKVLMKDGQYPIVICGEGLIKLKKISAVDKGVITFPHNLRYRFE